MNDIGEGFSDGDYSCALSLFDELGKPLNRGAQWEGASGPWILVGNLRFF